MWIYLQVIFRLLLVAYTLFSGVLQILIFFPRESTEQKKLRIQRWSQKMLKVFNIDIEANDVPDVAQLKGSLIVVNHISWLDIFILNAIIPGRFIAKQEVRQWPIIGYLADQAGTVFISRQRGDASTQNKIQIVADALGAGDQVTLFPEGTSTEGSGVLPFKASFFQAAIDAKAKIWPVTCFYPNDLGQNNINMAYYGDLSLWQSIVNLAKQSHGKAVLQFHYAIDASDKQRYDLAEQTHQLIDNELRLLLATYSTKSANTP